MSGYHQDYLGQLCRLGKIKAAKIGRNWYTTKSELQTLIKFTDSIEEESGRISDIDPSEESLGLFDLSAVAEEVATMESAPSVDGVRPQIETEAKISAIVESELQSSIEMKRSTESETVGGQARNVLVAKPVIADNYVISEVEGIPIKLRGDNHQRQHHTIQTLITRMKLDTLRTEVLQLSDFMHGVSAELNTVKQVLAKHEEILKHRKDLATSYAPSINVAPVTRNEPLILQIEDQSSPIMQVRQYLWLAPALAITLVVASVGVVLAMALPNTNPQVSTIYYAPPIINNEGVVAGQTSTETGLDSQPFINQP